MSTPAIAPVAAVGVVQQGHVVILVTVSADGRLLDRRRAALTADLPTHPYHHEGSWAVGRYLSTPGARALPLDDAIALVRRVTHAAESGAGQALDAVASSVPAHVEAVAIRACAAIPSSIGARIRDHRAQAMADSVMYREAVAAAATARGCAVSWYDTAARHDASLDAVLAAMGRAAGPPWQAAHRQAAAAALACLGARRTPSLSE